MKALLLVLVIFIASNAAAPVPDDQAKTIYYSNNNDGTGNYNFSFETSNGLSRSETGTLVNKGQPNEHIEVDGYYSYTDADGEYVTFHYTADENGFHIEPFNVKPETISAGVGPAVLATLLG